MNETHPPRFAEALLESFGADQEFLDAILGDLAQEHAHRVERFGDRAARMWYYRQAAVTAPHLLRNWLAGAKLADARRLLNVVGLAYVMTTLIAVGAFFATLSIGSVIPGVTTDGLLSTFVVVGLTLGAPILGGFLAATFEESRPMTAALALAFAWGAFQLVAAIWLYVSRDFSLDMPAWMRLAVVPFLMGLVMVGGAIRVKRASLA
jgi:hypothetical protein